MQLRPPQPKRNTEKVTHRHFDPRFRLIVPEASHEDTPPQKCVFGKTDPDVFDGTRAFQVGNHIPFVSFVVAVTLVHTSDTA